MTNSKPQLSKKCGTAQHFLLSVSDASEASGSEKCSDQDLNHEQVVKIKKGDKLRKNYKNIHAY